WLHAGPEPDEGGLQRLVRRIVARRIDGSLDTDHHDVRVRGDTGLEARPKAAFRNLFSHEFGNARLASAKRAFTRVHGLHFLRVNVDANDIRAGRGNGSR